MNKRKKTIAIATIAVLCLLWASNSIQAYPANPLLVYGKVYDMHGHSIGNIQVTLTNLETEESHVNKTPVTAADGYLFDLSTFDDGWSKGDNLRINSTYQEGGHTYVESYTFPIPMNINETGYAMNRPLRLETCIDCTGGDDGTDETRKPDHYYLSGTVYKQDGEPASGALVIVKNMRTGDKEATTTEQNGTYTHDLIFLENDWEYKDNIRINATYGTGDRYQIGHYDFKILYSLKNDRTVDVQMYQSFLPEEEEEEPPETKTKEEWITDYYTLWDAYNGSEETIATLQTTLEELQNASNETANTSTNHTQEEWNKLEWDVERLQRTIDDNTRTIWILAIVAIVSIIYILWMHEIIPLPLVGKHYRSR